MSKIGAAFIGDIYDVRTKKDGGGRISIDFSRDALADIQWAQQIAAAKGGAFQVALVPIPKGGQIPKHNSQDIVDPMTGEIIL